MTSLIFVESSFHTHLKSNKDAFGVMQIIPETARLLSKRITGIDDPGLAALMTKTPETNIQMGMLFFKRLLNFFNGNYELATVAYNMGPWWVKRKLDAGPYRPDGHRYLEKIREGYINNVKTFIFWAENSIPTYKNTLVAAQEAPMVLPKVALEGQIIVTNVHNFLKYLDKILLVDGIEYFVAELDGFLLKRF
jgi:soluble lytic murein transglycosylase